MFDIKELTSTENSLINIGNCHSLNIRSFENIQQMFAQEYCS